MLKLSSSLIAGAVALAAPLAPAGAAVLGPHAAACTPGKPAMLVRVEGLKTRAGMVRVQIYGGDPARYFEKGAYLERVEVKVPASGPVEVCMPVAHAGTFAVSVRHELGDGKLADGGGMSGNPDFSLMDVVFKRRPSPIQVQVQVRGLTPVPVTMNYVSGTRVGPASASR